MKNSSSSIALAGLLVLALCTPVAPSRAQNRQAVRASDEIPPASELLPNGRRPLPSLLTGGQPSGEQLERLARLGYALVIDLRTGEESGRAEEAAAVERLGMRYVSIPVPGEDGLTRENARRLAEALQAAEGPAVIHCASGNRVGALLALKAFWIDGASPDDALRLGHEAGLTRLEPAVRQRLASAR